MRRTPWVVALGFIVLLALALLPAAATAEGNSDAAKLCQKGGWTLLQGTDGTTFANQNECVSYAAQGGSLMPKVSPTLTATALSATTHLGTEGFTISVSGTNFAPNQTLYLNFITTSWYLTSGLIASDSGGEFLYSTIDPPFPFVFPCVTGTGVVTQAKISVYSWDSSTGIVTRLASTTIPVSCTQATP